MKEFADEGFDGGSFEDGVELGEGGLFGVETGVELLGVVEAAEEEGGGDG